MSTVTSTIYVSLWRLEIVQKDSSKSDFLNEPYHSYFEYYYSGNDNNNKVLKGITANVLSQGSDEAKSLKERRSKRVNHHREQDQAEQQQQQQQEQQTKEDGGEGGNGNEDAPALRDDVAKRMTPDQIAEAQKLAREWEPSSK